MDPCPRSPSARPRVDLVRLLAASALVVVLAAIALGRMADARRSGRRQAPVRYVDFNDPGADNPGAAADVLDLETGRPVRLALPAGERLDLVAQSPWRDARGGSQLVGRWRRLDPGGLPSEFGLARLSVPEGRLLDCVVTPSVPESAPSWFPGVAARVLFAGLDGSLYSFAFEDGDGVGDKAPRGVPWRPLPRGVAGVRVIDLAWSADPAAGGPLLATVCILPAGGRARWMPSRLWWLRLDAGGDAIVAAGPLTHEEADPSVEERAPVIGRSATGAPMLAFLRGLPGEAWWNVAVAPLRAAAGTSAPFILPAEVRELAAGCGLRAPSFGGGGRWVAAMTYGHDLSAELRLLPIDPPGLIARR